MKEKWTIVSETGVKHVFLTIKEAAFQATELDNLGALDSIDYTNRIINSKF